MKKESAIAMLGTAHLKTTLGKCSPDGLFREYLFSRKACSAIKEELEKDGYNVLIDYPQADPIASIKHAINSKEQSRELAWRVNFVNSICKKYGTKNCLYVPIHVNAAGMGDKWMSARGWCAYTSKGQTKGDKLSDCLYDAAERNLKLYTETFSKDDWKHNWTAIRTDKTDGDRDMEANFYVLKNTNCAACLTENMFQDNKKDVSWLSSEEGFNTIVKIHVEGIKNYIERM